MNIALWLLQGLLAALFLATGSLKVFKYERPVNVDPLKAPAGNVVKMELCVT